jgi:hypothetical protein
MLCYLDTQGNRRKTGIAACRPQEQACRIVPTEAQLGKLPERQEQKTPVDIG